ncbi:Apolipophorin [Portunus trituberculatus]|uniref:Apolipophorin n=1 Tax=Portunus trituberculatus TaxID=210409 RepID=A0A5B7CKT7_PORTR|nr:Apolipophorin [Portunus trituberculatus]
MRWLSDALQLKKIRIKLGHNHWRTDVILNWGQRIFTYHDEVNIPSLRGLSFKVEVNAPALRLNSIVMSLETIEEAQGGQTVYLHLQRHNSTLHSARVMFYKYDTDGESVWQAGATDVVLNKQTYQDVMFRHVVIPLTSGLEVKSNMTVGHTPLVIVAVRVTPDARALGLALCTTSEECVRVQAQARAQSTLSTRTLSVSVHALNSLFWKDEQEPLIQNSVTFLAEETAEKMLVSGGVQRLECVEVGCTTSTTKGLLHTTLLLTPNTLDVMVNTTHRTIALTSVLQESQPNEVPESSLPGGILAHSYILENQLWLDKQHDPSGGIRCTISLASYESSRASEYVLASSLHHSSFTRVLKNDLQNIGLDLDVQSSLILRAESTVTIVAVLDVFSLREDSLKMEVNLQQESARYILHGTLSKANYVSGRLVDATVVVVPSPDSCEFSIAVVILPQTPPHLPTIMPATLEFKLFCELDAVDGHTTVSCKFGMVDVHRAEVDLLSATGLSVQLHPPFLLYVTAHHSRSLQSWWQHIMIGAHDELYNLTVIARGLVQDLTTDLQNTESLVAISSSSSASSLVQHLCSEGYQLLQEVQNDQLLLDIIHSIQASIDVTSTIVETGFAYISRNYGETFQEVVTGIKVWLEAATMNIGSYFVQLVEDVQHYFITTLTFISSSPHMLLDQVLSVPLIEQAAEWTLGQIHLIQESVVYSFTRDLISIITSSLHKVLSFLYSEEEETHNKVDSEVWHFWVPLGKCSHSLLDVWQYISGTFKRTSHQEYLGSVLLRWWHLFTHPQQLFHHLSPPFPGEGAIIGNNNFITIDGRIFTLTPSCLHVLLTDAKHQSFTLLSHQQDVETGTNYTLLLQNTTVNIHSNMMVTIDNAAVSLPYISDTLNVVRQLHKLEITARHTSGEDLITFTCWLGQQACVVGVSGWLHADTKGLLGNFNLNPADDFMRPGGKCLS